MYGGEIKICQREKMRRADKYEDGKRNESWESDLSAAVHMWGGGRVAATGLGCLTRPWTVIYGSMLDVLMGWADGAYPSQVWSPIRGMDMLHGSLSAQHNTPSGWLTAFWMYINTRSNVCAITRQTYTTNCGFLAFSYQTNKITQTKWFIVKQFSKQKSWQASSISRYFRFLYSREYI